MLEADPTFDSLTTWILKAKYFPHSSFLESYMGNRPSFAWRTIFSAKELVQQGLILRVGDGNCIKMWGDRWIPKPTSFQVQSPLTYLLKMFWFITLLTGI
jgi:hypothetical protein